MEHLKYLPIGMRYIQLSLLFIFAILIVSLSFLFGIVNQQPGQDIVAKYNTLRFSLEKQQNRQSWTTWDTTCGFSIDAPKNWTIYHTRNCSVVELDSDEKYGNQQVSIAKEQVGATERFDKTMYKIASINDYFNFIKDTAYYNNFTFSKKQMSFANGYGTYIEGNPTYPDGVILRMFFFQRGNYFYYVNDSEANSSICSKNGNLCKNIFFSMITSIRLN